SMEYYESSIGRSFERQPDVPVLNRIATIPVDIDGFFTLTAAVADAAPPSAPATLTATDGVLQTTLNWTAATDNVGVTLYNVHRSTVSGFAPTVANRIAQTAGTSMTDPVPPGTYFYIVTAQDAALNVGPPSNQASATATPDVTGPVVSITAPAAGATL